MKDEYDFSKGVRGKFHFPEAEHIHPITLDPEVSSYLASHAKSQGKSLSDLVNELLRKDIELFKTFAN